MLSATQSSSFLSWRPHRTLCAASVALLLAGSLISASEGGTIYVDAGALGIEDGSYFNPFNTIQEGINAASAGDEVVLFEGTYAGPGNRALLVPCNDITVRAMFSATGPTTINGGGNPGFIINGPGAGGGVRIEGLTLTNCYNPTQGGAIDCQFCDIEVVDCTFTNDTARLTGGAASFWDSNVLMDGCTLTSNSTDNGGAVHFRRSTATVTACDFGPGNDAVFDGGAILADTLSDVTVSDTYFLGCSAGRNGGAIKVSGAAVVSLSNGAMTATTAAQNGGAVVVDAASMTTALFTFDNCSATAYRGGAIYAINDSWLITSDSYFYGCQSGWGGGGVFADASVVEASGTIFRQ
ncbi:MAG: hypothetical protein KDA21_14750, partial [Phycisphaerales bacterium]|nr:hypothetical protein [Phycisphaerales bacterium]